MVNDCVRWIGGVWTVCDLGSNVDGALKAAKRADEALADKVTDEASSMV